MLPLYLGQKDAQLFATLHLPEFAKTPRLAVLLCNPFGQEAIRMHRFFRVLSERLNRLGIPVMRFEYFGTGDSAGSDEQADLQRWSADALLACEELKQRTGLDKIRWLGARIGANIAVDAIREGGLSPESVTLWEPIVDGEIYVEELRSEHEKRMRQVFRRPDYPWGDWQRSSINGNICELSGYPLSAQMVEQLRATRLHEGCLPKHCPVTIIQDPTSQSLCRFVQSVGLTPPVRIVDLPATFTWSEHQARNGVVVPSEALKCLLQVLGA